MLPDIDQFADVVVEAIKDSVDPLSARITVLEGKAAVAGKDGRDGTDGKDAPLPDLDTLALKAAELIPAPKDGRDGADGKDGVPGPQGEKGLDGKPGDTGPAGPQGEKGLDGETGPQGEPGPVGPIGLQGPAGDRGATGEPGAAGRDGVGGQKGLDGAIGEIGPVGPAGKDGANGLHGKDGLGIVSSLITDDGILTLTMTDGSTKAAGRVVGIPGRDGLPGRTGDRGLDGKDGADGLGFDDIVVDYDGERNFSIKFARGERVKHAGTFTIPALIYRDVFSEGKTYQPGDAVTWGGSLWIAKDATNAKPGDSSAAARAWKLAVKKGSDGKPGPQGKDGAPGPRGEKGDRWEGNFR